jgi:hypothetical protein
MSTHPRLPCSSGDYAPKHDTPRGPGGDLSGSLDENSTKASYSLPPVATYSGDPLMDLGARHRPYAVLSTNERVGHTGSVCPSLFGGGGFRRPSSPVGEEDSVPGFVFPVGLLMGGDVFDRVAVDGGGIGRFEVCRPGPSANYSESFDGTRVPTRSRPDKERTVVPTVRTGQLGRRPTWPKRMPP